MRTLLPIIGAMTSSFRNSRLCVTGTVITLSCVTISVWPALKVFKVWYAKRSRMIWSRIFGKNNIWRKLYPLCYLICRWELEWMFLVFLFSIAIIHLLSFILYNHIFKLYNHTISILRLSRSLNELLIYYNLHSSCWKSSRILLQSMGEIKDYM